MSEPYRNSFDGERLDVVVTLPTPICEKIREAAKERGETFKGWRWAELVSLVGGGEGAEAPPKSSPSTCGKRS